MSRSICYLHKGQTGGKEYADTAVEAWEFTTGNQEVIVVIFDIGINLQHPDLKSKIVTCKFRQFRQFLLGLYIKLFLIVDIQRITIPHRVLAFFLARPNQLRLAIATADGRAVFAAD